MQTALWHFIRGDMPLTNFTAWLYAHEEIEAFLGPDFYLDVVSTDFENEQAVADLKETLAEYLDSHYPMACSCIKYADLSIIKMGDDERLTIFFSTVNIVKRFGDPCWWLAFFNCAACHQNWLIAQESRINDIYILQRISVTETNLIQEQNEWPLSFRTYKELLKIGKEHGVGFRFFEPLSSPSLCYTIDEIVKEDKNIQPEEISQLMNLDIEDAKRIYDLVINPELFEKYDAEHLQYGKAQNNELTFWQKIKKKLKIS